MNVFRRFSKRIDFSSAVWVRYSSTFSQVKIAINSGLGKNSTVAYSTLSVNPAHPPAMTSVQVAKAHSHVKPPNVLVLQQRKDSTSEEFSRIREALDSCLTPERYVVYPLGIDEIQQSSPWQDNCRLLLVPPSATERAQSGYDTGAPRMTEIFQEIASYVGMGGAILSMNTELNGILGLDSFNKVQSKYCQHGVCNVAPKAAESSKTDKSILEKFNALQVSSLPAADEVSCDRDTETERKSSSQEMIQLETGIVSKEDLAVLIPVEIDAALEWLDVNTNQCNNVASEQNITATPRLEEEENTSDSEVVTSESSDLVCVKKLELERGGKVILSSIDLFPLVPRDLGVKMLVWLKRGVEQRRKFLSSLLLALGLECSEENLPELTHTYLVCSGEVRNPIILSRGSPNSKNPVAIL